MIWKSKALILFLLISILLSSSTISAVYKTYPSAEPEVLGTSPHYSGLPKVDEILYKAYSGALPEVIVDEFLAGVTDWIEDPDRMDLYDDVVDAGHKVSPMDPMAEFSCIAINCRDHKQTSGEVNKPLNDSSFRWALSYIYGMDDKQEDIFGYMGAPWISALGNPVPPAQEPWHDEWVEMPDTDWDVAWDILKDAGYTVVDNHLRNPDGSEVRDLDILYTVGDLYAELGPIGGFATNFNDFIAYIGAISPTMTITPVGYTPLVIELFFDHDYDFVYYYFTDLGVYVGWLYDFLHSDNIGLWGSNFAGIADTFFDGNTTIILTSLDEAEIIAAASDVQQRFVYELMPWFPIHKGFDFCITARDERGELMNVISMPNYGPRNDYSWMTVHWRGEPGVAWPGGTVITALRDEPHTLNPYTEYSPYGWQMLDRAVDRLLRRDPTTLTLMPWIATNYTIEHHVSVPELGIVDGSIVTFYLRQDVYWQDGEPVTAYDCVNNMRILREYQPPIYSHVWANLVYEEAVEPYKFSVYFYTPSLYYAEYVAETALLAPKHITDLVEQQVEDGILPHFFNWAPGETTSPYLALTGEAPPTKYPFMKQIVGCGPYVYDYYNRPLAIGRVARYEEYFVSAPVIGGVVGDYRTEPDVAYSYKVLVQNIAAKENTTDGEVTDATVTVKIYEDDVLKYTIPDLFLETWEFERLGPYTTPPLSSGLHNITVEIYEGGNLIHTYLHKLAATKKEDVNLNLLVGIDDIAIVDNAWASYPGHSNWDPRADITGPEGERDFVVGMDDITQVSIEFPWEGGPVSWPPPTPQVGPVNLAVDPKETENKLPADFTVDINITDVTDLSGYEFKLYYDTKKLDLISIDITPPTEWGDDYLTSGSVIQDDYSSTQGRCHVYVLKYVGHPSFSGSKTLAELTFRGAETGNSILDLTATILIDSGADPIPHSVSDGSVEITLPDVHDVAITDIECSHDFAFAGETVNAYVDVWNLGHFEETFNVTAYADSNVTDIGDEIIIGNQTLSLPASGGNTTLTFAWNTTDVPSGNYTISAIASEVPEEGDASDNTYIDSKVEIIFTEPCYDINITCPSSINLNPNIFNFDKTMKALTLPLGNMTIESTGFEGYFKVAGSKNNTIHLYIDQLGSNWHLYYLPENGTIDVPLWLTFEPGTYSGEYELDLTVCGTYKRTIIANITHMWICGNGVYTVENGTVSFDWNLTGGSAVYITAEPILKPGWSYSLDPRTNDIFETPHIIRLNITAAPDAEEGDIGIVILRAFKNDTNMMFWQFTYFSALDTTPPTIEGVQPPSHTNKGTLLFSATVKDLGTGIESVQLCYSVDDGPWNNQTMKWKEGDTFNSTTYTLEIPAVPNNSKLEYYIVTSDWLAKQTQCEIHTMEVTYDLVTMEIETAKTVVGEGFSARTSITIENQGTVMESLFKVAVYAMRPGARTRRVRTETVPFLANGASTTLELDWNTMDIEKGNYTISAFIIPVLGETDWIDNIMADGWVRVAMAGDVSGPDGVPDDLVDIDDVVFVAVRFGAYPGHTKWNINADITEDGVIDIDDVSIPAVHFGEIDP